MPKIIAITNLGSGNKGAISAADLSQNERDRIIAELPKYQRNATKRFRCVDGRTPEYGLTTDVDEADPQEAGGAAISETAADLMQSKPAKLTDLVVKNIQANISNGFEVVMHGDDKHGKSGCGANKHLRAILRSNAENETVITPIAWTLCQQLGLDKFITPDEIKAHIQTGKQNADDDALWNATPEQIVDLAVSHGVEYEELIEDHMERFVVVDMSDGAFDEEQFIQDHKRSAGKPIEVFVASFGAIQAKLFAIARVTGQPEVAAARKMLGVILFNIGVPKELTAESTAADLHAALPVVIIG